MGGGHDAATRIVAIRHGETDWNVGARIQGHTDVALNATGHWQARRAAQALADEAFDAVYASDLRRAADTAAALAAVRGAPLHLHPGLRERAFGVFEGLSFDEIGRRWPEQAQAWRRREPHFGPDGGETLSAFYARCVATVLELAARHPGGQIAIVTHGGVLDCLYRAATRIELQAPRTWQVANAGINRLLAAGGALTLVGWADTAHLERGARDETAA
ncbi:histidine phosphatase family protein [Calidifontimicrobium sp. SYSU G02091]|uniref:histidine phosphatase family protein n=1 Tax=Calidifontimicrobium sp. SYSU G02091 TaxID=2926421 RepID=UPI001F5365CB|nr:histidine phosphatase family protein [Calidifontimicrobium sp. SYSU G02091]MCI1190775.1 histidine phosphatase family protein [Calidifontimicrobium sp. SYSU G02091]